MTWLKLLFCHIWFQSDVLSAEEWAAIEEMGILIDQDDQGVLLQVSTCSCTS